MPNEKAFNEPEDVFSKNAAEISRRFCEPSEGIYKNSPELTKDPFKAIEAVNWHGPSLTEIEDPVDGLLVAAAKHETAQRELRLTPKQREHFEGVRQNIDGAIGFLDTLRSRLESRAVRAVASGATVIGMALGAAGCGNAIARPIDEITPNTSPITETTPTDNQEVSTITPEMTVFPKESSTPVEIWGASYPTSSENFIQKPSISGAEARKIIIEKGAGEDLKALENWYKAEGIIGSGMSNFTVPVVYQEGGNFNWNLMVKNNNGNFLKFTITSGKEEGQVVRAMGMVTYLGQKPSFEVSELKDPTGMESTSQQVIWDKSGWSLIGAFQGNNLIAWFHADAPGGGEWVKVQKPIPTVEPTKTPEASEYFSYSSSIDPKRLAEIEAQYYPSSDYLTDMSDQVHFPAVGVYGYPVAYNLKRDENGTQLFVLLATGGGLIKTEVKVSNFPNEAWPSTMYEVDRIDSEEAKEISGSFDSFIKRINEGEKIDGGGSYIILISINSEANTRACLAGFGRIENAGRLCKYDASNATLTPQQMLDKIESSIIPIKGKTPEESLDLESYPALSSEGNMYVEFQLPP